MLSKRCHLASEALFENGTFMIPRQSPNTTSTFGLSLSLKPQTTFSSSCSPPPVEPSKEEKNSNKTELAKATRARSKEAARIRIGARWDRGRQRKGGRGTREDMQEIESRTAYTRDAPTKYDVRWEGIP